MVSVGCNYTYQTLQPATPHLAKEPYNESKDSFSTALLVGSLLIPSSITIPAIASTDANYSDLNQQSTSETTAIVSFLKENGVPEEKQKELMDRLARGEIWDSMKGVEPVSEVQTSDGKVISTYPDGSVAVFSYTYGDSIFSLPTNITITRPPSRHRVSIYKRTLCILLEELQGYLELRSLNLYASF